MATLPPGVTVPVMRQGRLTVCAALGDLPYDTGDVLPDKAKGFDMDLLGLVAQRFGVEELVVQTDYRVFLTGQPLKANGCDVLAGELSAGPDTAATFDATAPYLETDLALLARKGSRDRSLGALPRKRVAVVAGSPQADYLSTFNRQHGNGIQVTPQSNRDLAMAAVHFGRADAALFDSGAARYYAARNADLIVSGELGPTRDLVFGVRPGNTVLRDQVSAALADAGRNRQYAKAYATWFGGQPSWVPGG
jgi:ABC-type amino acid transport substrate-binding protein